jgi:hypothetical protein
VTATGKKGMIAGGEIITKANISARVLGATMGTQTLLEIGIGEEIMNKYKEVNKEIEEMQEEMEKSLQTLALYKKKIQSGVIDDETKKKLLTAKKTYEDLGKDLEKKKEESQSLKEEIESYRSGRVKFSGTAYPGVRVNISNVFYTVKDEVSRGQFVREKGEIKLTSL